MMNQVVNTNQPQMVLGKQDAWWVAGFMVAGVVGLVVIALVFRRNVEL